MRAVSTPTERSWRDNEIPATVRAHLCAIIEFVLPPDDRAAMAEFIEGDGCMIAEKRLAFERMLVDSHARLDAALETVKYTEKQETVRNRLAVVIMTGCFLSGETDPAMPTLPKYAASVPVNVIDNIDAVRDYVLLPKEMDEIGSRAIDVGYMLGEPLSRVVSAAHRRYMLAFIEMQSSDVARCVP